MSNMTSKGQVTVPKVIRDALGLRPGEPVEFATNEAGEAVIRAVKGEERLARLEQAMLKRVEDFQRRFKAMDQMPGVDTDEYVDMMRGPPAEI